MEAAPRVAMMGEKEQVLNWLQNAVDRGFLPIGKYNLSIIICAVHRTHLLSIS